MQASKTATQNMTPPGTFDLAQTKPGDIVTVTTYDCLWHFRIPTNATIHASRIEGVAIMDSGDIRKRSYARTENAIVDRVISLGEPITVNGRVYDSVVSIGHKQGEDF